MEGLSRGDHWLYEDYNICFNILPSRLSSVVGATYPLVIPIIITYPSKQSLPHRRLEHIHKRVRKDALDAPTVNHAMICRS